MPQILIADDDAAIRVLWARVLSNAGYRVKTIDDGHAAVELVAAAMPDLLITDLMLPGLNGWSVFSRVRTLAPRIPILIISAVTVGTPLHGASLPNPAVFLRKPVAIGELVTTVARLLAESPAGGVTARGAAGTI